MVHLQLIMDDSFLFFSSFNSSVPPFLSPAEMKPVWWPEDIPWQNVRSDMRSVEKKKEVSWTEGLRRIVISCYLHHGRLDLLPEFSAEHLHQTISPETAQQIQLQLERLQQQHSVGGGGAGLGVAVPPVVAEGTKGGAGGESGSSSQLTTTADNQQVFTVDTGIGNCDNAGMPTLADATLAEAAAKLQQVCVHTTYLLEVPKQQTHIVLVVTSFVLLHTASQSSLPSSLVNPRACAGLRYSSCLLVCGSVSLSVCQLRVRSRTRSRARNVC